MELSVRDIAQMIDHSLLRPNLSEAEFMEGIELSKKYQVATCSVVPYDVARSVSLLAGSGVPVSTVVGFPHGTVGADVKVYEAKCALEAGALELDMVMAISRMLAGDEAYVEDDIRGVVEVAHAAGASVKVILETCYLTEGLIINACRISERAGADFVKTSTGYGSAGATLDHVRLMRRNCPPEMKVKAAGGIRTLDEVLAYRAAGVDRIATRASAEILEEAAARVATGNLVEAPAAEQ